VLTALCSSCRRNRTGGLSRALPAVDTTHQRCCACLPAGWLALFLQIWSRLLYAFLSLDGSQDGQLGASHGVPSPSRRGPSRPSCPLRRDAGYFGCVLLLRALTYGCQVARGRRQQSSSWCVWCGQAAYSAPSAEAMAADSLPLYYTIQAIVVQRRPTAATRHMARAVQVYHQGLKAPPSTLLTACAGG
jgi:hypothetical protein